MNYKDVVVNVAQAKLDAHVQQTFSRAPGVQAGRLETLDRRLHLNSQAEFYTTSPAPKGLRESFQSYSVYVGGKSCLKSCETRLVTGEGLKTTSMRA